MNFNIIFTKPNTAELLDKGMPTPGAGQVRVKLMRSCVSSGTERANLIGTPDANVGIFSKAVDPTKVSWPRQSGYSSSGVIDAVGEGVKELKVGDRVAVSWTLHSQYICVPEKQAYLLPDNVSFEAAALTHIATFPLAALRKCRLEIGEGAIVMGQGILGQLAVALLHAAGATPVIAADPVAEKRTRALEIGADLAVDPTDPSFVQTVKKACVHSAKAMRGLVENAGPQVGIEVTGVGAALDNVLDVIAPFGRIALLGCTRDSNFSIDYYHKVHGRGVTLVGAHSLARTAVESAPGWWTLEEDAKTFIRLLSLGRLSLEGFVSEVHSPADCGEVYARLAKGGGFPVVQFDWSQIDR